MKKLIALFLVISVLFSFAGCRNTGKPSGGTSEPTVQQSTGATESTVPSEGATQPTQGATEPTQGATEPTQGATEPTQGATEPTQGATEPTPGPTEPTPGPSEPSGNQHKYQNFTQSEKSLITERIGYVIPFIPCDEYTLDEYSYDDDGYSEFGVNFYTFGNTAEEFAQYRTLFASYTFDGTEVDEYGDTWYFYSYGDVMIDMTHYYYEGEYVVDLYAYVVGDGGTDDSGNNGGSGDVEVDSNADAWREAYDCITIQTAYGICDAAGSNKSQRYYLIGTVVSIQDDYYGKMIIKDATGELLVYGSYGADGKDRYGDLNGAVPQVGDVVLFYGNFMKFNGTREMYSGWIIDFYTPDQNGSGNTGDTPSGTTHVYNDFSAADKNLIASYIDFTLPFLPCDEYKVEYYSYAEAGYAEEGINFYTFGNTAAEFAQYRTLLSKFTFDGTDVDEYGDTWYYYSHGQFYIDVSYYYNDGAYVMDLYAYIVTEDDGSGGGTGSGNQGDVDIMTNDGAGLPSDSDGVYDVDFRDADKVKDVTDQGSYLEGCPTTGSPAVLVIPVEFSDSLASTKGYTTTAISNAFMEGGQTDYYSVHDYYYITSYGKLDLDITVLDFWFKPKNNSTYYYNATYEYYGDEIAIGDQLILDEALAYLESRMDLSKFDSDNNGIIDAVILVNTLDIAEEDFYWAYRYWNVYTDQNDNYYEYDGVSANDYVWASYQFLQENYDDNGNAYYDKNTMNTYTFIHEFAHVLGVDDYYDTEYKSDPMAGCDVMDSMTGDHNAFTKINLGWITTSRLVVTNSSVTLKLEDFSKRGDTIIIGNNWDPKLGAYQEYYILAYYKNTGLNGGDYGYFSRDGVVVYHVNASLFAEVYDGEIYYDIYNTNTDASSQYGTEDNLIEYVKSAADTYTYITGDKLPTVTDDNGDQLGITFKVDSLTADYATITFTVK